MKSKVLQNIENADLEQSKEEFRNWVQSAANLIDGIFSPDHQTYFDDPSKNYNPESYYEAEKELTPKLSLISQANIDRLCEEFETVFDYAKHREARIDGELVLLYEIESIISRFMALGRWAWQRESPYTKSPERQGIGKARPWDEGLCVLIGKHVSARWSLDFGVYLSLAEIALLAHIDERTVHNATLEKRPGSRLILEEHIFSKSAKYVHCDDALKWLEGRRKFKKTKTIKDEIAKDSEVNEEPATLVQVQHFVPVASDASIFHPVTCKSPSGCYSVGAKGEEEKFESYFEALVELQRMPVPCWRRPNVNGHFGIVKGVSWERKSADELGLEDLATGMENLASLFNEE